MVQTISISMNYIKKNYDLFLLLGLILFCCTITIVDTYLVFHYFDKNSFAYGSIDLPCFIREQTYLVHRATFNIYYPSLFSKSFQDKRLHFMDAHSNTVNSYALIEDLAQRVIEGLILFGVYFIGKKLYYRYKNKCLRWLVTSLFFLFWGWIAFVTLAIPPIACSIHIS